MSKDADFAEWISDLNDGPLPGASHGEIWAKVKEYRATVAHELAEKIRAETAALKKAGVLEPDKFRPCRDAADQIDPEVPGG